jgi:hypothetical protein
MSISAGHRVEQVSQERQYQMVFFFIASSTMPNCAYRINSVGVLSMNIRLGQPEAHFLH